jgi:ankyrin repeat protein
MLIERGADVTCQTKAGSTALNHASQFGDAEVVRMLIERGADVTAQYHNGQTPLHLASLNGQVEIVRVLIKYQPGRKYKSAGPGRFNTIAFSIAKRTS